MTSPDLSRAAALLEERADIEHANGDADERRGEGVCGMISHGRAAALRAAAQAIRALRPEGDADALILFERDQLWVRAMLRVLDYKHYEAVHAEAERLKKAAAGVPAPAPAEKGEP